MDASNADKPATHGEFAVFRDDLFARLNTAFEAVSANFNYVINRLDDIDRRLEVVELRTKPMEEDMTAMKKDLDKVKGVAQDTKRMVEGFVPRALDMFASDGIDVANLRNRVEGLEKSKGGN